MELGDKKLNPLRGVQFCEEPIFAQKSEKPKGSKKIGLDYEKFVAEIVDSHYRHCKVTHGPWIQYSNSRRGKTYYAQPDIIIVPERGTIIVIECKLTWKEAARDKLRDLYVPLIRKLYPRRKVAGVQVCANLTPHAAKEALSRVSLLGLAKLNDGEYRLVHQRYSRLARRSKEKAQEIRETLKEKTSHLPTVSQERSLASAQTCST